MKKNFYFFIFLIFSSVIYSISVTDIEKWIINFPKDANKILDYPIKNVVIEQSGMVLELKKDDTSIKIITIKKLTFEELIEIFSTLENVVLNEKKLKTDNRNIQIKEAEISIGLRGEVITTIKLNSFRIKINQKTTLELLNKIKNDAVFNYYFTSNKEIRFTFGFSGINLNLGNNDNFPGWDIYVSTLIEYFKKGIEKNDRSTMALILETKIMDLIEIQKEKRKVLGVGEKSNIWIGFNFDYYIPSFFSKEPTGYYFNIFSYNVFEPMIYLSFRNIGNKKWKFKPIQFYVSIGGFFEVNASYSEREKKGEFDNYKKNGSFLIAGGPSFAGSVSCMIPKIDKKANKKEIFGIGIESINNFNIPYFANDYAYEYFYQQFINLVFHIIPYYKIRTDIILGMNLSIGNESYDINKKVILSKIGVVVGARLKIDIHNFYKIAKLF